MEKTEDVLYVVMPAYNEEENIQAVVESWIGVLDGKSKKSRLVIADSGSKDKTHEILLNLQKKYKNLEILEKTNQYHGPKVIALYNYAIKNGADYVFQTDSDGQTSPEEFAGFWKDRHKYDGILGHRRKRGDGKARAFVERVVCMLLKLFFGIKVPDANAPFRLMKASLLKKYIDRLPKDYDLPNIMLTAYFVKFGENVIFREVTFEPRKAGVNSIDLKKIFKIGRESLPAFWRFRKDMYKINPELKKQGYRKTLKILLILLCFAVVSCMLVMIAPAFPWNTGETMTDSSVFVTVGRQMQDGAMPYLDTFDHKGPLLYLINYFGLMFGGMKGIFVFEALAIFATMWFMYKIVKLKVDNDAIGVLLSLVAMTPFITWYVIDWGNFTEQYAMPFIAGALYVFLKYFVRGGVSKIGVMLAGVCFACVAMLRVNMVGVWCVMCLAVVIGDIVRKRYRELVGKVVSFAIGGLIVVAPIVIWLIAGGAFGAFVDDYIKFNLAYSNSNSQGVLPTIFYFLKDLVIFLSLALASVQVFTQKSDVKNKKVAAIYLITYAFVVLTACMSGNIYPHYGMILAPMVVWPFAVLYGEIDASKDELKGPVCVVLSLGLIAVSFANWTDVAARFMNSYRDRAVEKEISVAVTKACEYINEYTEPSDKIVVYGNWNQIYVRCNRLPASKYSYQFPIARVRESIMTEFLNEVAEARPKVFVVQAGYADDGVKAFLAQNGYDEEWRETNEGSGAIIYVLH